jgi:hypothetical protein
MKLFRYYIVLFTILFSNLALADEHSMEMPPEPEELLSNPISLDDICSEVRVVEWRDSGAIGSKPTAKNIATLKADCKEVMEAFPGFVIGRGFKITKHSKLHTSVCLLPDSTSPRDLNDIYYRFYTRDKSYDEYGHIYEILGYFQRYYNHIYVINTAATRYRVVFMHELFHAASYYYGIYAQHTRPSQEELLAQDFTASLGYGR